MAPGQLKRLSLSSWHLHLPGERGIKHRDITGRGCSESAKGDAWPKLGLVEEKVTPLTHASIINTYWEVTEC